MGFFDRPPPEPIDQPEYEDPYSPWIGGDVPVELLLARSDSAAVVVRGLVAFPDGFEFSVDLYTRRDPADGDAHRHGLFNAFHPPHAGELPPTLLRFGLEFPDGARVTSLDDWGAPTEPADSSHGMQSNGAGGSQRQYSSRNWAWPLPTSGPLTFVCEWPEFDIPETRDSVDAALFTDALDHARPIFPDRTTRLTHPSRALGIALAQLADPPT